VVCLYFFSPQIEVNLVWRLTFASASVIINLSMISASSPFIQTLEITNLPSLPHTLLKVLDLCGQDEASLKDIADIIEKDAALSAKVISASNSAYLGRQDDVESLEQRLTRLGLDMVQTIVIGASVYQVFNNLSQPAEFDLKAFWRRSLTNAVVAKLIAQHVLYDYPEEAYLTGLLLDIGQLVLVSNYPKQYAALMADKVDGIALMSKESEAIGGNHCEIGAWLVSTWNLKSFMADAVLYHHVDQDQIVDAHKLIKIAHLTNSLTMYDEINTETLASGQRLLSITPAKLQEIIESATKLVIETGLCLGMETNLMPKVQDDNPLAENLNNDDLTQKRMQLAIEIGNVALIGRNPLGSASTLDELLFSIQRSTQILFGFKNVIFFIPDEQGTSLKGKTIAGYAEIINEMTIPLNKANSCVTNAFLNRLSCDTLTSTEKIIPSILDEQLIRLMQAGVLYCQPMIAHNTVTAIMVFGILPIQFAQIENQKKLIAKYAQQSAQAILTLKSIHEQEERNKKEILEASKTEARKIVHEANNPLSIIKNYIQILRLRLPKESSVQEELNIIKEEIDRVSRVIKTVSTTTEFDSKQKEELNANEIIQNISKILVEGLFSENNIAVNMQLDQALPTIVTDKDKLIQILINLMKNAAEAMKKGGNLQISTRSKLTFNNSEHIEISIKDNGPGIPTSVMENLFKPATSTNGYGHEGLGLSIVNKIVDELGGKISCQSDQASGTTFQILLPRVASAKNKHSAPLISSN